MSTLAIVGHGFSMQRAWHGSAIDAHDCVVRLKRSAALLKYSDLYGSKTDVAAGAMGILPAIIAEYPSAGEYWCLLDSRGYDPCLPPDIDRTLNIIVNPTLSCSIDEQFRIMRKPYKKSDQQVSVGKLSSPTFGHNHTSQGVKALAYAMVHRRPSVIRLFGFDSVWEGRFSTSVTRGLSYNQYPDHNWQAEHDLVDWMMERYKVPVEYVV